MVEDFRKIRKLVRERGMVGATSYCVVHAASLSRRVVSAFVQVTDLARDRDILNRRSVYESFETIVRHDRATPEGVGGLTEELLVRAAVVAAASEAVYCVTDMAPAGSVIRGLGPVIKDLNQLTEQEIATSVFLCVLRV